MKIKHSSCTDKAKRFLLLINRSQSIMLFSIILLSSNSFCDKKESKRGEPEEKREEENKKKLEELEQELEELRKEGQRQREERKRQREKQKQKQEIIKRIREEGDKLLSEDSMRAWIENSMKEEEEAERERMKNKIIKNAELEGKGTITYIKDPDSIIEDACEICHNNTSPNNIWYFFTCCVKRDSLKNVDSNCIQSLIDHSSESTIDCPFCQAKLDKETIQSILRRNGVTS